MKPLLFLHGMFGGPFVLQPLADHFASRGHKVFLPDLYSSRTPETRFGDYCGMVAKETLRIRAAEREKPILIGHSMGGLIAMCVAGEYLVGGLVLISSAPPAGISVLSWELLKMLPGSFAKLAHNRPVLPTRRQADILIFNRMEESVRRGLYARLRPENGAVSRQLLLGVRAPKPNCPTLIIRGGCDRFVPPPAGKKIGRFCGAKEVVITEGGHMLPLEHPERVAAEIESWLR